jgi:8-oxo-dGTP pyrophosphatase MutT (NUDIX family)
MYVFPGGKLAASDGEPAMRARLVDPDAHQDAWGGAFDTRTCAALGVAAIRETFEEAGVLLAEDVTIADLHAQRAQLLDGASFAQLLDAAQVKLRLANLQPLSRWITPAAEPRRYDACFYVARAPEGQDAIHDRGETVAGCWRSPAHALREMAAGQLRLSPPTARTLESLVPCCSVEAAFELARGRRPPLIEPIIRPVGEHVMIFYPGDPEHPVAERALPGPTRAVLRPVRPGPGGHVG